MTDIDPDKLEAALDQLEAERERRLQAKIDSGEVVSVQTVVVVDPEEDIEDAKARALARHPVSDDGRAIHREFFYVFTGVPRDPDFGQWEQSSQIQSSSKGTADPPDEVEPAASGPLIPCSQPTYVQVTTRAATDDGDPGVIAEAYYTIEDGLLMLRDADDKHITSRALFPGQDSAAVARTLLRESNGSSDFNRPLAYPKLGLA
jgi:hypothetical protein